MNRIRKWTKEQLERAVIKSKSYRNVIKLLGLQPAGGNYDQIKKYIREYGFSIQHFTGKAWNRGKKFGFRPLIKLENILVKNSTYQSFKLKRRLFLAKLKEPRCEECGWAKMSKDGRVPLELDHVNGDRHDNRINNLKVLCPNCHSLQSTHRGRNRRRK